MATNTFEARERRQRAPVAPYISYKAFKAELYKLSAALPAKLDDQVFGEVSPSYASQMRGTLRYFDLIDEWKRPTQALRNYARSDEEQRRAQRREMFVTKLSGPYQLAKNEPSPDIEHYFENLGLSGTTPGRAVAFFESMAQDVGLLSEMSLNPPVSASTPTSTDEPGEPREVVDSRRQRQQYLDMLMSMAKEQGGQSEILDRIERLLGFEE